MHHPAHRERPVKRPPPLRPVVGDLRRRHLDERAPGRGLEIGQGRQLARRTVDRVLDRIAGVGLLHAGREQLDQLGEDDLRVLPPHAQREPDQAQCGPPPRARLSRDRPRNGMTQTGQK